MTSSPNPGRKARPGVDRAGRTPLHNAVIDQNAQLVSDLLKNGADVNVQDDGGWTPLHFAAANTSLEIVEYLIAAGCSIDPQNLHGNSPLSTAVFTSRGNGAIIIVLRSAGASAHLANKNGVSPLKLARTIANFPVSQFFQDLS